MADKNNIASKKKSGGAALSKPSEVSRLLQD